MRIGPAYVWVDFVQVWADDAWQAARSFLEANHYAQHIFPSVEARATPPPPLALYVAGPLASRGPKADSCGAPSTPWLPLFYCTLELIKANRPLPFLLEESDRIPAFQKGKWWWSKVQLITTWGCRVHWAIYNASQHGLPQHRPPVVDGRHQAGHPGGLAPTYQGSNHYTPA